MSYRLTLKILPDPYAICQLPPGREVRLAPARADLFAVIRTSEEVTLVCLEGLAPGEAEVEPGWRVLKVVGPLDFSLVGILAELSSQLAAAGISIFALSTFDTDYLLVKSDRLVKARTTLAQAGHTVLDCLDD